MGRILIILSILTINAGILLNAFSDKLGWVGHLRGDIRIEKDNFRF